MESEPAIVLIFIIGSWLRTSLSFGLCAYLPLSAVLLVIFIVAFMGCPSFPHSLFNCRLNATDFLVRLRGKRLMLIGDSMNRNQFESMLCLLREGLSNKSRMFEVHGYKITKGRGYYVFKFVVSLVQMFCEIRSFQTGIVR